MPQKCPVTAHIFFMQQGKILLLRRHNTGFEDGRLSVVAGHLESGESVIQAGIREAREEIGVILRPQDLSVVGMMHRKSNDERLDFFLVAENWSGTPANLEPHKCSQIGWFQLESLHADLIPYVSRALHNYQQGIWFEEFGWQQGK